MVFLLKVTPEEVNELNTKIVVRGGEVDLKTIRLLTHLNVSSADIELALKKIGYVCKELEKKL
jgi:hypothetical protein